MTGTLLIAPERREVRGAMVFLAGPIQGTTDWQADAVTLLRLFDPRLHIANPRRAAAHYAAGGFTPDLYREQVDWETAHLRRSAQDGAILFWLAREAAHDCSRAYAQTTRFELAEWKTRHQRDGTLIALGIEDGFPGARYIRHRFGQDCPRVVIRDSLEETCADAVRLAYQLHD